MGRSNALTTNPTFKAQQWISSLGGLKTRCLRFSYSVHYPESQCDADHLCCPFPATSLASSSRPLLLLGGHSTCSNRGSSLQPLLRLLIAPLVCNTRRALFQSAFHTKSRSSVHSSTSSCFGAVSYAECLDVFQLQTAGASQIAAAKGVGQRFVGEEFVE